MNVAEWGSTRTSFIKAAGALSKLFSILTLGVACGMYKYCMYGVLYESIDAA